MVPQGTDIRFELILTYFPNESALEEVCQLIYNSQNRNLVAALSSTPYTVGRSFPREEQEVLSEKFKSLGVGFQFKSKPPYHEIIQFDPQYVPTHSDKKNKIYSLKVLLTILALIFAAISVAYFLPFLKFESFWKLNEKGPSEKSRSEKPAALDFDAELSFVIPKVEYRASQTLFWENAQRNQKLKHNDAIRTFSKAAAVIRYRDGSYVRLKENTLLTIGETQISNEEGTERELELKDGSLQARLEASPKPNSLAIRTPEGVLQLKNTKNKKSSPTQVITSFRNGELEIKVAKGSIEFKPKKMSEKPIRLQELQRMLHKPEESPQISDFIPEIEIISPENGKHLKFEPNTTQKFIFEWENIAPNIEYEWTLWSDAEARNLLLSQKTTRTSVELKFLDVGALYWKVEATYEGIKYASPLTKIYVEKHNH